VCVIVFVCCVICVCSVVCLWFAGDVVYLLDAFLWCVLLFVFVECFVYFVCGGVCVVVCVFWCSCGGV